MTAPREQLPEADHVGRRSRTAVQQVAEPPACLTASVPPGDVPDHVFRAIADSNPLPFALIDRAGVLHFVSRTIDQVLGWTAEEVVGRSILDFLDEEDVPAALDGLADVQSEADVEAGVPVIFPIRHQDGSRAFFEVSVVPVFEHPELDLVALRLRPWDADHHLGRFMELLLADGPLDDLFASLSSSVAASVLGRRAAVHHGWDGRRFAGVSGSWPGAERLPLAGDPYEQALDHDGVLALPGHWLLRVGGGPLPPAVLSIWTDVSRAPLMGHRNRLARAARYIELAVVRTAEHERLRHFAEHDALTGVANRGSFLDRLTRALADGEDRLAVVFCDVDGFKALNDSAGHAAGDAALVDVVARLRAALRDTDELARMGGDEFTVLARGIHDARAAEELADRLLAAMDGAPVGLSLGIAVAGPGATADGLLSTADEALYESKRAGGRRHTIRP